MTKFQQLRFCRKGMKKRLSVTSASVLTLFLLVAFIFLFNLSFSFSKESIFPLQTSLHTKWIAIIHVFNILFLTVSCRNHRRSEEDFDFYSSAYPDPYWYNPETTKEEEEDESVEYYADYASSEDDYGDEFHGYGGYEEEDDDDDNDRDDDYGFDSEEEEDPDYELKRKGEEFIATMYRKWKEELIFDRLLLTAELTNCSYMEEDPRN